MHAARGIKQVAIGRGWSHVVVCASGPSFSAEQAALLNDRDTLAALGWRTIAINTSYQKVPTADVLYAGDASWWEEHLPKVQSTFAGECWTIQRRVAHQHGLCLVEHSDEPGLCNVAGRVHSGGNSGHAAIGLAYLFGARQILLVGFDFQDSYNMSHWHGDHPKLLNQERPYDRWLRLLPGLVDGLKEVGVEVINCSIDTAIPSSVVPRANLDACLCRL